MLVRCLYASRILHVPTPALLDDILEQSRRNNPERGITGLLCHTQNSFVQVVEGGRDAVSELLQSIYRDDRHTQVTILLFEEITERRFGNWTMARVNVEVINPSVLLKYSERPVLDPFACSGHAMLALLYELIATGSAIKRGAT